MREWRVEDWVRRNLVELYRRNRIRILDDHKIMPGIERELATKSAG